MQKNSPDRSALESSYFAQHKINTCGPLVTLKLARQERVTSLAIQVHQWTAIADIWRRSCTIIKAIFDGRITFQSHFLGKKGTQAQIGTLPSYRPPLAASTTAHIVLICSHLHVRLPGAGGWKVHHQGWNLNAAPQPPQQRCGILEILRSVDVISAH